MQSYTLNTFKKVLSIILIFLIILKLLGFSIDVFGLYFEDDTSTNSRYQIVDTKIPSEQYSSFNWYMYNTQFNLFEKIDKIRNKVHEIDNGQNLWGITVYCSFGFYSPSLRKIDNINLSLNSSFRSCSYRVYDLSRENMTLSFNIPIFGLGNNSTVSGTPSSSTRVNPFFLRTSYTNFRGFTGQWIYNGSNDIFSMSDEEFDSYLETDFTNLLMTKYTNSTNGGESAFISANLTNTTVETISNGIYNFDFFVLYSDWAITTEDYPKYYLECVGDCTSSYNNYYVNGETISSNQARIPTVWDWLQDVSTDDIFDNENGLVSKDNMANGGNGQIDYTDILTGDNVDGSLSTGNDFFNNFEQGDYGLVDVIKMPLTYIQQVTNGVCTPLSIPLPFVDNNLELPCVSSLFETYFSQFLTVYRIITDGIIAYWVCIWLYKLIMDLQDPEKNNIEVMDL